MNIVFDFGAVVFRWRPAVVLSHCLPAHTADPAALQALIDGFFQGYGGDWGDFDRGTVEVPQLCERIAGRVGLTPAEVLRVVEAVPDELQPLPATVALMRRLRAAGHRLFYLSNMPAPYADHLEREHDFFDWFDDGVFSSRVRLIKPDPAIFALATDRFGIDPARTLFLDDSPVNVSAARAAGWQALPFTTAADCEPQLQRLHLFAPLSLRA